MIDPSTRLLFKLFRVRLTAAAVAAFGLMFVISLGGWKDGFPMLAAIVGLGLGMVLRLHSRLYKLPFPVSDRQAVWIPMTAIAVCWLAGLAGAIAAQSAAALGLGHAPRFGQMAADLAAWIPAAPATAFAMLAMLRILRINPGFIGFVSFMPFLLMNDRNHSPQQQQFIELAARFWPLFLVCAVFLVWEAPAQWAVLRRLDTIQGNRQFSGVSIWNLNGPMRPKLRTLAADALLGIIGLLGLILLVKYYHNAIGDYVAHPSRLASNPFQLFFFFPIVLLVPMTLAGYRQHRASGFGQAVSLLLLLMRGTWVLNPLAAVLGARRGSITRCGFCAGYKFAWQPRCPHCAESGEGATLRRIEAHPYDASWFAPGDLWRVQYRFMIPMYLIIFVLSMNIFRWTGQGKPSPAPTPPRVQPKPALAAPTPPRPPLPDLYPHP